MIYELNFILKWCGFGVFPDTWSVPHYIQLGLRFVNSAEFTVAYYISNQQLSVFHYSVPDCYNNKIMVSHKTLFTVKKNG